MATIEDGSAPAECLAAAPVGWVTTVSAEGQPQTSYTWFHFDADDLLIYSEAGAPKIRNVVANPKVFSHHDRDRAGGNVLTLDAEAHLDS